MATGTTRGRFWGPAYPDVWDNGIRFWGGAYPEPAAPLAEVDPVGPDGVATLMLDLEGSLTITHTWATDLFKSYNGLEKRAQLLDRPKRSFKGGAYLVGMDMPAIRARLARFAQLGSPFLIGMPYYEATLQKDSVAERVFVADTTKLDWANAGQRVIVRGVDGTAIEAVIQAIATSTDILLDVSPGACGVRNATIMPLVAVYLDAQQGFARYPNPAGVERWNINAQAMLFGFQVSAVRASLDIEATYGGAGNWIGAIVQARVDGVAGNSIRVAITDDSISGANFIEAGNDITIEFVSGVTTVEEVAQAINANSSLVRIVGNYNPTMILESSDQIPLTFLAGGSNGSYRDDGSGASLTMYSSKPVWDRFIRIEESGADSMQAMNDIVDMGGVPESFGQAKVPDWGRQVGIDADIGPEFQWLLKFLAFACGRWKSYWLPTWRNDLEFVSKSTNTITIAGPSDDSGGFFTWYPDLRRHIQILQQDGTITRREITAAVDNGNGTVTLTIGATISSTPVVLISWIELCRFENDSIDVVITGHRFKVETLARAVQQ